MVCKQEAMRTQKPTSWRRCESRRQTTRIRERRRVAPLLHAVVAVTPHAAARRTEGARTAARARRVRVRVVHRCRRESRRVRARVAAHVRHRCRRRVMVMVLRLLRLVLGDGERRRRGEVELVGGTADRVAAATLRRVGAQLVMGGGGAYGVGHAQRSK